MVLRGQKWEDGYEEFDGLSNDWQVSRRKMGEDLAIQPGR